MTQHSHQTAPTQFVDNHGSKYQYSALFVADATRSPGIDCVPEPVARAFKAAIGQSPHQYVSAKRLERAKALLIRGDQEIRPWSILHSRQLFLPGQFHTSISSRDRSDTGSVSAEFRLE